MKEKRKVISVSLNEEELQIFEMIKDDMKDDDLFVISSNSMVFRQIMWSYYFDLEDKKREINN